LWVWSNGYEKIKLEEEDISEILLLTWPWNHVRKPVMLEDYFEDEEEWEEENNNSSSQPQHKQP